MNTDAETRFIELIYRHGNSRVCAREATANILTEYAVIPREDFPELDKDGLAVNDWWDETYSFEHLKDRRRRLAAFNLARVEWLDAKEARDAEAKLSERRNKVLKDWRERSGSSMNTTYENLQPKARLVVDMVLEAEDGAGK